MRIVCKGFGYYPLIMETQTDKDTEIGMEAEFRIERFSDSRDVYIGI